MNDNERANGANGQNDLAGPAAPSRAIGSRAAVHVRTELSTVHVDRRPAMKSDPRALPALSVVIPVRDEAAALPELHRRLLEATGEETEIVFVDDGSSDGSREILVRLAAEHERTVVAGFRRGYGKSHALSAGFRLARGRTIATIDADLQDAPEEIPSLLRALDQGFDVAGGWRRSRKDSTAKVWASRVFNRVVSLVAGYRFRDINCGLKAYRREVIEEVRIASGYHRFLPLLAYWRGFRVTEIPVSHDARRHGRSKYGFGRAFRGLLDLAVLLFLERYEGRPGRFVAAAGTFLGIAGLAILVALASLRFVTGSIQSRYPLLALGLLLVVVGMQLVSLGFIAELVAYHFRSRAPHDPRLWSASEDSPRSDEET